MLNLDIEVYYKTFVCTECFINTITIYANYEISEEEQKKILLEMDWLSKYSIDDVFWLNYKCDFCRNLNDSIIKL